MSKKVKIAIITVSCILTVFLITVVCSVCFLFSFHKAMINSKPDTSDWNLTNGEYTVVPIVDKNVSFIVKDKNNKTVFECSDKWRAWDFHSIDIDSENNITANSSDTGIEYYKYDNGKWVKSD